MAVSIDDLLTPLASDGSDVRNDLVAIAAKIGLTIPSSPSEPGYQLVDMLGRWGTSVWNTWAIPALKAQFGRFATGDWATLFWRARGVDRNLATFAGGPCVFENRTSSFVDISAAGDVQFTAPSGATFTSVGPPTGSTGTLAPWSGSGAYPQTTLTMQAGVVGTGSNTAAATVAGYPTALVSGPPGVYVVQSLQPALIGTNQETDAALLARGRATIASYAPLAPVAKYTAIALGTQLPGPPATPVSTNRIRVLGAGGAIYVYLANPSGPSAGDTSTPGTDVYQINANLQRQCGAPGLSIVVAAANELPVNLGALTLYLDAASGVTVAQATATAQAALAQWGSTFPIGGLRKAGGGQGYVLLDKVLAIAQSQVVTSGGSPVFQATPGVIDVDSTFTDTEVAPSQVPVFSYTISVVVASQL